MKILVRCVVSKMGDSKWILKGGEVYEAEVKGNKVSIRNHYNEIVELDLKEFNYRFQIIKKFV